MLIHTLGYGGRNPSDFVGILKKNGIRAVVDIRLRPDRASMGSYVKAKSAEKGIQKLLAGAGIGYHSFIELGNVFLDYEDWRERYAKLLEGSGELLTDRLVMVAPAPFCLLCAEKKHEDCHRLQLADYLAEKRGYRVTHL